MSRKFKMMLVAVAMSMLMISVAHAEKTFIGEGSTFITLTPSGPGVWQSMMKVGPITPPSDAHCVVVASWTANLGGIVIQTTIDTSPNTRGPWVQVNEAVSWESGAMTQAFNITGGVPVEFWMNAENQSLTTSVNIQNTRIWTNCALGTVPLATSASSGPGDVGN